MPITHEDVARMATLARLDVPPHTQTLFARQFADILTYMDVLNTVDTAHSAPMYSPSTHEATLREDIARPSPARTEILGNAPQQDGEYFIVPRIV